MPVSPVCLRLPACTTKHRIVLVVALGVIVAVSPVSTKVFDVVSTAVVAVP